MRTGMILAWYATPTSPMPLLPTAAIVPATAVPWPFTSLVLLLLSQMFHPGTRFACRSGWFDCTPLSRTATVMPAPVDVFHAVAALIFGSCHSEEAASGSFVVALGATTASTSA